MKFLLLRLLTPGALLVRSPPLKSDSSLKQIIGSKVLGCGEHASPEKESVFRHDFFPPDVGFGRTVRPSVAMTLVDVIRTNTIEISDNEQSVTEVLEFRRRQFLAEFHQ